MLIKMNKFIKTLKHYRHTLPKQTIKTLKGQALSGDILGATKGLEIALSKKQDNKNKFTNAHRNTKYINKKYGIDYKDQFSISLKYN